MGRAKRIWYLSPMRATKVQASLRIRVVSPEPPLLAHTSSEKRGTFRQKARMAGHAQLKFVITECSKTQIRLTRPKCSLLALLCECKEERVLQPSVCVSVGVSVPVCVGDKHKVNLSISNCKAYYKDYNTCPSPIFYYKNERFSDDFLKNQRLY